MMWMLGSPNREPKASQSRANSQPDPLPDGEIGGCSKTRKRAKGRAPILLGGNSSRHFRFHSRWLGRFVLSSWHEVTRFSFLLRHSVCYGRGGLDFLRMPFCDHG